MSHLARVSRQAKKGSADFTALAGGVFTGILTVLKVSCLLGFSKE